MATPAKDPAERLPSLAETQGPDTRRSKFDPVAPTELRTPANGQLSATAAGAGVAPQQLGPYEIVRPLGQGGMGTVYEAFDTERKLRVALKTLRPEMHASLARFWNEFHALAELRHENLVRIYELMTDGPVAFYTMELVEGVDFRTWVMPTADASAPDVFDMNRLQSSLRQLAEALHYIHTAGHLHRDLKPSNVLVTHAGKVKLVDFGLAARIDHHGLYENSAPGQPVGTLAYMAPEQAAGEDLTAAADWYSVGVMLYECLLGKLPFTLNSPFELQEQKRRGVQLNSSRWSGTDLGRMCDALLRADPQQRPTGDEILQSVGSQQQTDEASRVSVALIGRDGHLDSLREAYGIVETQQRACAVFLRGKSGIGKSELIRCFLEEMRDARRAEIFRGRCYDSVFAPYKAFEPIIAVLARRLQRMDAATLRAVTPLDVGPLCEVFPVLAEAFPPSLHSPRKTTAQEKRHRAFTALRELWARLGPRGPRPGSRPIILFIDDLQWGDVDSAMLLNELLRAPAPPLLLLCAFRSEDEQSSPCLQALIRPMAHSAEASDALTTFVDVEPLTEDECAIMASQLLERPVDDGTCRKIAREANGNPLFVHELVRSLSRMPPQVEPGQQLETGVQLEKVLWNRIEALAADQRQLLLAVALAERPIERHVAYLAAGFAHQDPAICDALIDERLLRSMGSTLRGHFDTYHDRVRETILSRVNRTDLRDIHQAIAASLQQTGSTDDEFVGQQLFAAGDVQGACERFRRAADQAAHMLAFDRAARLYRIVLENGESANSDVLLRRKLAAALANTGRCAEAAEQCLAAVPFASADEALQLQREAALRYLTSGHLRAGIQTLSTVLENAGMRLPRTRLGAVATFLWWRTRLAARNVRPRLRKKSDIPAKKLRQLDACWSAAAGLSLVDPLRAAAFVARHLALAQDAGEPERLLRALAAYTGHVAIGGSRSRRAAGRVLDQLRLVATEVDGLYPKAILNLSTGIIAHLDGRWDDAWTSADAAEQLFKNAEQQDVTWELDTAQTFAMWARMYAGRWHELAQRQPELRREAIERDDLFGRLNFGARMAASVYLAQDRPQEAQRIIDDDQAVAVTGAFHVQHHNLLLARVLIHLYENRAAAAWALIGDGWSLYRRSLLGYVQQVRVDFLHMHGTAALAAAAHTKDDAVMAAAERTIRQLMREPVPWSQAIGQLLRAQLAILRGQSDGEVARLDSAAAQLELAQMGLLAACARWRFAEQTGDARQRQLAVDRLHAERFVRPEKIVDMFLPVKA